MGKTIYGIQTHYFEVRDSDIHKVLDAAIKFCKVANIDTVTVNCLEGFSMIAHKDSRLQDLITIYQINKQAIAQTNQRK